ncbi:MAG: tyrosine-type recombinase/integrase [Bacteroidales bacterium]|nr:tyrosine-type recombinase/integrase [Candidatus Cryptobacteroides equifaecalis]
MKSKPHEQQSKALICDFLSANNLIKLRKRSSQKQCGQPVVKLERLNDAEVKKLNTFLVWLQNHYDYSQHSLQSYMYSLADFFSYFQNFSEANVRAYINDMEANRKYKPSTVALRMTALKMYAQSLGKAISIKRRKMSRNLNTENVPSEREYRKLLDYLRNRSIKDYLIVRVLATTGARHSELLMMRWEDILKGELVLKGKGAKFRRFFFTRELIQEVQASQLHGYIEASRFSPGGVRSDRCLGEHMKQWADACGIDRSKLHPHAFRHFFAKMYLKSNKDVVQLAELLGHESIDTTRIYLQKTKDEQQRDFNKTVAW